MGNYKPQGDFRLIRRLTVCALFPRRHELSHFVNDWLTRVRVIRQNTAVLNRLRCITNRNFVRIQRTLPLVMHAAKTPQIPDPSDQTETDLAAVAEYWAGRAMWVLVMATSLWDIDVTFARPFALAARLF
jgi:hypothetical protein